MENAKLADIVIKVRVALNLEDTGEKVEQLLALKEEVDRTAVQYPPLDDLEERVKNMEEEFTRSEAWNAREKDEFEDKVVDALSECLELLFTKLGAQDRQEADAEVIKNVIDDEISRMIDTVPQEVVKSPLFLKHARDSFNTSSAREAFKKLESGLMQKPDSKKGPGSSGPA